MGRTMPTEAILKSIRKLGYHVSVFHVNGVTEMHADLLKDPDQQHVARSLDGVGKDDDYRTACLLAELVGIELEDG